MSLRQEVLVLYRRILRLARSWESASGDVNQTAKERKYIHDEAKSLFKKNKNVTDENEIREHLKEAETRVQLALHYKIPYPRPVNIPQNVLAPTGGKFKQAQKRKIQESIPVYYKSYDNTK